MAFLPRKPVEQGKSVNRVYLRASVYGLSTNKTVFARPLSRMDDTNFGVSNEIAHKNGTSMCDRVIPTGHTSGEPADCL